MKYCTFSSLALLLIISTSPFHAVARPQNVETTTTTTLPTNNNVGERFQPSFPPSINDPYFGIKMFENDTASVIEFTKGPDPTLPDYYVGKKLSFNNLWTIDMWDHHTSRLRYLRHIIGTFDSALAKRILNPLLFFTIWSAMVVLVEKFIPRDVSMSMSILTLVSSFIAALLTLRTNQSLSRLIESRKNWGRLQMYCRDTAQMIAAHMYKKDPDLSILLLRHLSLFGWILKSKVRGGVDVENLRSIVKTMLPEPYCSHVLSMRKKEIACVTQIRFSLSRVVQETQIISPSMQRAIESNLMELNRCCGANDRILSSPIPPFYSSHTTRLLVIYLLLLPVGLIDQKVNSVFVPILSAAVGFAMLGLDEISHLMEQPFRVMPMQAVSKGIMKDVADAVCCQPPTEGAFFANRYFRKPNYW